MVRTWVIREAECQKALYIRFSVTMFQPTRHLTSESMPEGRLYQIVLHPQFNWLKCGRLPPSSLRISKLTVAAWKFIEASRFLPNKKREKSWIDFHFCDEWNAQYQRERSSGDGLAHSQETLILTLTMGEVDSANIATHALPTSSA